MQDLAMPAKTLEMYRNKSEVGQNLSQNKVTKDKMFSIPAHCKTFGIEKEKVERKKSKLFGFLPTFPPHSCTLEILPKNSFQIDSINSRSTCHKPEISKKKSKNHYISTIIASLGMPLVSEEAV